MRISFAMKLPLRFKIFYNVSEDYYFIKERFCFFWYVSEQSARVIKDLPQHLTRYSTIQEAEAKIQFILEYEKQSSTPDEIKLVKTL